MAFEHGILVFDIPWLINVEFSVFSNGHSLELTNKQALESKHIAENVAKRHAIVGARAVQRMDEP